VFHEDVAFPFVVGEFVGVFDSDNKFHKIGRETKLD
jgi:hypothetical protein